MSKFKVLDSWALLAYFEGQMEGRKVREILKDAALKDQPLFMTVVNWGEVLYVIEMRHGSAKRNEVEDLMNQIYLELVPVDRNLSRQAAHLKASLRLPYADCFAAGLAKMLDASVVTGDQDFKRLGSAVQIEWLA